jgi:uncharacterized protein (UPF0332 family)
MTLTKEDKINLSESRMQKAMEFLDDSRANLSEGRIKTSVNRSYYAALNAIRSLLILEGVNPESHDGAITLLSLRFIKTNQLPIDIIKKFKSLLTQRTDVDYGDFEVIEKTDAVRSQEVAEEIIGIINTLRKKLIKNL